MNSTIVLAEILGIVFVVMGISMLSNTKGMMAMMEELVHNKAFMWLGGIAALFMGAVFVTLNNVWTSGLPLLVTIIGWLALIKGIFLLVFPGTAASFYKKMNKSTLFIIGGLVVLVIGLFLLL